MANAPYHLFIYNLPQGIADGIKLYGYKSPDVPEGSVLLFNKLGDMEAHCTVQGTETTVTLSAATPLVEHQDGYLIEEVE